VNDVFAHITANQERYVKRLQTLLQRPSVAAQNLGIQETAEHVVGLLEALGAQVQLVPTEGAPVVVGVLKGKTDKTLSFYNHYDVQPAEPLELWESDPWGGAIRDGRLYARGAADNKGDLVARISAVESYLAVHEELPCTLKFIVEGEEEVGSPNLEAFAKHHAKLIHANGCIWEFGSKDLQNRPLVTLGLKGICYVELRLSCARSDLHSSWAAVVPNAAWRLTWALGTLKGPDERVRIAGFYDEVAQPNAEDIKALQALGFDERGYKAQFGIENYVNALSDTPLLEKLYFEPTCTLCGFDSGYTGEGAKTVSPHEARAKLDFRLVPDQDPGRVVELLRKHLDLHGFADVELSVLAAERAGRTPLEASLGRVVMDTAKDIYDVSPVLVPIAPGSGPIYALCQRFGIPGVSTGCAYSGSQVHAPNENIRLKDFERGTQHIAAIVERFAQT